MIYHIIMILLSINQAGIFPIPTLFLLTVELAKHRQ